VALLLEEEHLDWPGILVQACHNENPCTVRCWLTILVMSAHPAEQVEDYEARGYDPNQDQVGLTGVEYTFEDALHGRDGSKLIEVDIAGREVQTVGEVQAEVPGNNLRLTLDLGLQQTAAEVLTRHMKAMARNRESSWR